MIGERNEPLLHHLKRGTENRATDVGFLNPETALKAVCPAGDESTLRNQGTLILLVGNDFSKFHLNILGIDGLATKSGEGLGCLLEPASLDEVARRVWEEHQANAENESPKELDGNWDAVSSSVGTVLGGINNNGGEEDTNGDTELVTSDEGTTNFLWAL